MSGAACAAAAGPLSVDAPDRPSDSPNPRRPVTIISGSASPSRSARNDVREALAPSRTGLRKLQASRHARGLPMMPASLESSAGLAHGR